MTKIIWMSDLHFKAQGDVLDHDPCIRLAAAIDHVNAHHADAAFCVVSGDMVNRGTTDDYAALAAQFATLTIPVMPMVGNHDDRRLLRDHFAVPVDAMEGFVQYAVPFADGVALCLDTQKTGSDAGAFCAHRLAWLRDALAKAATPVYLFLHHPPVSLGLPMQDQDRMEDPDPFLDLIAQSDVVRHLFIGHVHRPITGTLRSIPFATMRSVLYQAPPPLPAWDWNSFAPASEAPQIGILTFDAAGVQLQYDQFCAYEHGVTG